MSAPFLEVLATPALNSVQDLGRPGQRRWGIGPTGMVDALALQVGNALLGNAPDAAGLELQLFPVRLRVLRDGAIALTGADCAARLDGRPVPPWWALPVRAGQVLELSPPGATRRDLAAPALRACLSVAGGIDVPEVLDSRATHVRCAFGGLEGRALRAGDVLDAGAAQAPTFRDPAGFGALPPATALPLGDDPEATTVRVIPAAEYPAFTEASHAAFWNDPWRVTIQSDRMGMRLEGTTPLKRAVVQEMRSHGIVCGVVQVPPGGHPIIQLNDGNTAGGYPKMGVVIDPDLWRLAQLPPRRLLRFQRCDLAQARAAALEQDSYLAGLRRLSALSLMTPEAA